ncbi:signal peptide-containing protein [Cryptosporidium canis]|uniref:Signal peptide-containing protein n=1 Tax=Cryptosporidium canis TaxID=195482 RepID=A0ABQ8P571_9CRYT|nr:signal peptide-containing protein [Cryptosporidium canis]
MKKLQRCFGAFLAGLLLNAVLGTASTPAPAATEIPAIATPPRESCSMGFSCQQSLSCRGGSVIGLCSRKLGNGYTLRLRGKIPESVDIFTTKFNGYIVEQTRLILRVIDGDKQPFADIAITSESIGIGLVGKTDDLSADSQKRIYKGIALERGVNNFRVEPGDEFDMYIFYRYDYFTVIFKHKDGKYYEAGGIFIQNKSISSIVPISGPMDYDILFEQSMSLTAPLTYVRYATPANPTPQVYAGPFGTVKGKYLVYPGSGIFEDGIKFMIAQGDVRSNNVQHKFIRLRDSKVQVKITIGHLGNYRYRFLIENSHKSENKEVVINAAGDSPVHVNNGGIAHLGYLFTDGHLLICISDSCFASTEIKGGEIGKIESNIWFTITPIFALPEQSLSSSAVGRYKCRIGETSCYGVEYRLQNPLSPGQRVEIQSLYNDGDYFRMHARVSQKNLFGAIVMGDSDNFRAAVFLAKNAVSLAIFSESGILIDSCSIYLSGNNALRTDNELKTIVGISNDNKLGVSGYVNGKPMLYCDLSLGSISITRIRSIKNNVHSGSSRFTLSSDYPAAGYEGISGGSSASRTQQQAANCYLATNGECYASKIVHMDGLGFVDGTYLTVKSSSVTFPFTFYVKSTDNNSDQFSLTVVSTGKFSMRNINTQDVIYSKIPPSCMERILLEGLSILLSSNKSRVFASVCGFVLGSVPSTSLNKKLTFIFHANMKGNSVQVSTFPVYGGGNVMLDHTSEKYSTHSQNIVGDDDLSFASPCDARKSVSTRLDRCSSLINMSESRLTDGYSIIITGTVEKPSSSVEQAFNIGIPIDNVIQVFNLKAANGRTLYQFFITQDQLGLSIHHHNGIIVDGRHVGVAVPSSVNLEEGSRYRIGLGFKDSSISMLIETPFGSGKYSKLRRSLVSQISGWGETIYSFPFTQYEAINSIVPELLVKSSYDYSLSNNVNSWLPVSKDFYTPRSGDNSCTLSIYGVCTTSKVFMPGNKLVLNDSKFIMRFYTFQNNSFSIYLKREDGVIVAQFDFTSASTMWNGQVTIKFRTRSEESTDKYTVDLRSSEFIISLVGNSMGYQLGGQWKVLLALRDNDNFNQIMAPQLDGFVVEYIRTSNSNPSPWEYLKYGSTTAKASMTIAYDQCRAQNPSKSSFPKVGVNYPASAVENLCPTALHPNKFAVVMKSQFPSYVKEEVAKTFPNFPGFLNAIVLLYNGSVVYTLIIARKYISFFNSLYSGEAGNFASCSSQVPDESEFQPGKRYHITFYVHEAELHVYFHSFKQGKSALLCKLPYINHFNAAKSFGQIFPSSSNTQLSVAYNLVRTLYNPTLNSNNLYPMGTVVTKNAILSSGMPFSPNESLSVQMTCGKDVVFSGQTGRPQLTLKTNGSKFTLENIPGKISATGTLSGDCVCSNNKKIVVNLAYVSGQFRLIACKASAASILTTGVSIYQISSEAELKVIYRTDLRLAVATSLTSSQISKVEEQPDTSKDEAEAASGSDRYIPEAFEIQATMHVVPSYVSS